MKIKTCFFVLTLSFCNLIKGGVPTLEELKNSIKKFNYFHKNKIEEMCNIGSGGYGFTSWQAGFYRVLKSSSDDKVELIALLLALGILQVNYKDKELIETIQYEMGILKELLKVKNLNEDDVGFNFEDLANELRKRREQAPNRVQIKEKESSSDGINHAKKRKRIEIKELKL